jgi:hypothetical protein
MLEEGQLIMGLNHSRMRKCIKTVYVLESTYHRETFPTKRKVDTTLSLLLEFDQTPKEAYVKITQ